MTKDLTPLLRSRAAQVRSAVDAVLDLVLDVSPQAPSEEEARRLRADAFVLAAALGESASMLERTAGLLESVRDLPEEP